MVACHAQWHASTSGAIMDVQGWCCVILSLGIAVSMVVYAFKGKL